MAEEFTPVLGALRPKIKNRLTKLASSEGGVKVSNARLEGTVLGVTPSACATPNRDAWSAPREFARALPAAGRPEFTDVSVPDGSNGAGPHTLLRVLPWSGRSDGLCHEH